MDQQHIKDEHANEVNEQQQNTATEQPPQIFMLNIDCFEKVFDYLSLEDLNSMRETCTRMERVTGHFYQQQFAYGSESKYSFWFDYFDWNEYKGRVCLSGNKTLNDVYNHLNIFKSAKKIHFSAFSLESFNVLPALEEILNKIEHVSFDNCRINEPLFEGVLGLYTNIKSLKIDYDSTYASVDPYGGVYVDWLDRKYPRLEHFSWNPQYTREVYNLQTFFQRNRTIHSFSTRENFLRCNEITLRKIKLDDIFIKLEPSAGQGTYDFLNELHAEGIYKRLHIECVVLYQADIDRLGSLSFLTGFFPMYPSEKVDLSPLVNLKVLGFNKTKNITNIPGIARSLENLIEVRFRRGRMNEILPFIHMSAKLKKMIIKKMENRNQAMNPIAMNREREKLLPKALHVNKVMIYIPHSNYLATKWNTTDTDLNLVEIRHYESEDLSTMFDRE